MPAMVTGPVVNAADSSTPGASSTDCSASSGIVPNELTTARSQFHPCAAGLCCTLSRLAANPSAPANKATPSAALAATIRADPHAWPVGGWNANRRAVPIDGPARTCPMIPTDSRRRGCVACSMLGSCRRPATRTPHMSRISDNTTTMITAPISSNLASTWRPGSGSIWPDAPNGVATVVVTPPPSQQGQPRPRWSWRAS